MKPLKRCDGGLAADLCRYRFAAVSIGFRVRGLWLADLRCKNRSSARGPALAARRAVFEVQDVGIWG